MHQQFFLTIHCPSQYQVAPKGLLIVQQEEITLLVRYIQDLQYMYLYQSVDSTEREAHYETVVMNVDESEEQSKSEEEDEVEEEEKVEEENDEVEVEAKNMTR